LAINLLGLY